jgi:hypothetical protein
MYTPSLTFIDYRLIERTTARTLVQVQETRLWHSLESDSALCQTPEEDIRSRCYWSQQSGSGHALESQEWLHSSHGVHLDHQ